MKLDYTSRTACSMLYNRDLTFFGLDDSCENFFVRLYTFIKRTYRLSTVQMRKCVDSLRKYPCFDFNCKVLHAV